MCVPSKVPKVKRRAVLAPGVPGPDLTKSAAVVWPRDEEFGGTSVGRLCEEGSGSGTSGIRSFCTSGCL